jgi:hypothetical protein
VLSGMDTMTELPALDKIVVDPAICMTMASWAQYDVVVRRLWQHCDLCVEKLQISLRQADAFPHKGLLCSYLTGWMFAQDNLSHIGHPMMGRDNM